MNGTSVATSACKEQRSPIKSIQMRAMRTRGGASRYRMNARITAVCGIFGGTFMRMSGLKAGILGALIVVFSGAGARAQERPAVKLEVDLRDAATRVYHSKMEFPVTPGPLTLVYPKWIPGEHAPTAAIVDATGLRFRANGKQITWRRDLADMFAFHCEVPAGVTTLEVTLDYLLPTEGGTAGAPSASAKVAVLPWNLVVLYPQSMKSDDLKFAASVRVPEGWKFATAMQALPG